MRSRERRVRSRKPRPPGTKIFDWNGRSAPPDSIRLMIGSRFWAQISMVRPVLSALYGLIAPPLTVGSFAVITHSTPDTTPIAGDDAAAERELGAPGAERRDLEEGRVAIEQQLDALARHQLAALEVALHVLLAAARAHERELLVQDADLLEEPLAVLAIGLGRGVDVGAQDFHGAGVLAGRAHGLPASARRSAGAAASRAVLRDALDHREQAVELERLSAGSRPPAGTWRASSARTPTRRPPECRRATATSVARIRKWTPSISGIMRSRRIMQGAIRHRAPPSASTPSRPSRPCTPRFEREDDGVALIRIVLDDQHRCGRTRSLCLRIRACALDSRAAISVPTNVGRAHSRRQTVRATAPRSFSTRATAWSRSALPLRRSRRVPTRRGRCE